MKPYRIGSGAGYSGDRIDPAQDLAERGELDALILECLAERTIALAHLRRSRDPEHGYDALLEARMRAVLLACVRQGGATLTLVAFAMITWRGLRVAVRAPDRFGAFLAIGLTGMVAVQAFVNLSVVLGLVPTKGIPLPFVSSGGSSLLINLVGMGILLNVSQHASAVHER